jgi:hypothetical protein
MSAPHQVRHKLRGHSGLEAFQDLPGFPLEFIPAKAGTEMTWKDAIHLGSGARSFWQNQVKTDNIG